MNHTIHIQYYAVLREKRGLNRETISTQAATPAVLYQELKSKYLFPQDSSHLRVAVNNVFADWATPLKENDTVVFIPQVAGG